MEKYSNIGRNSGVRGYEIGADFIKVQFKDGAVYLYTYLSAGSKNIEWMKRLAVAGKGLNSFIKTVVNVKYASKLRW